jgi:hypothetical protein
MAQAEDRARLESNPSAELGTANRGGTRYFCAFSLRMLNRFGSGVNARNLVGRQTYSAGSAKCQRRIVLAWWLRQSRILRRG